MAGLKEFHETLKRMSQVHNSKSEDYASQNNPLSNFDMSELGLKMFPNPRDGAFIWPIFTKLARLSTLLNQTKAPNNESIEDSMIDIAVYLILWKCDYNLRNK